MDTDEQRRTFAKGFMDLVYDRIKHGDEKHQQWLKDECIKLEGSLLSLLDLAAVTHPPGTVTVLTKTR